MPSVCLYFQVHQPRRLKQYRIFDIGKDHSYFNEKSETNRNNQAIIKKIAQKCYLPANKLLLKLLKKYPTFRITYSFSGVFLDQLEEYYPEVLKSFQELVETGHVEILSETYYHSLSFLYSVDEFIHQIKLHSKRIEEVFGVKPKIFRNTELIYNNDIGKIVGSLGYKGVLAEGADHILQWRSPNYLYKHPEINLPLLLKNYKLSDDIAFRFSSKDWPEYPLTADKFSQWISALQNEDIACLFMDYETFGEHQWEDTGIFNFLGALPEEILKNQNIDFITPSEAVKRYKPVAELDIPEYVSWADTERDLSAWLSNPMQHDAAFKLYAMEEDVLDSGDKQLIEDWRRLQTSDHFYYMCTKWFADGDVHKYFNPYESPYEAFITFMNVLKDLKLRLSKTDQIMIEDIKEKLVQLTTN
ncbi:alpha-amylase [Candidatus Roizmanbacteria bacterium RIFCSPLOWO2_02_FULL_37_19]|uniref:Alpha-amylase n=1 Tax=Candidatus Roizmanbacteria bacterium RIFCSPHIGHO2_02_FULL_37_24 TaxID=1802037 RepID=A0A1F7GZH0_9BACT|nr:MAG: alpha-amylase [Candidatus Roizmanbacteria bacterium RIFCSPHIGHO2_01_FULL_38_41]OGK24527.1 MAG: alpha-amylase [Candidatus Roizmanbacteria bacterium RIFCSPHIGHO2_02_FULL_37_24]OGK31981.1 MAG: alpha-amylase [Candidatus Roizmanbacteria bacterium RIFCSPHIGHO2_12_FULL_37_23]OGK43782.1 MAG: alpha-amylase [Candidatus Roizmanbacteria bacterium RIFCSPLOWO2_01_FULL_37_57]OGK54336.1 MAG: alpha-amylase [Candidatus Roizmanbacteria bacterium RIFCSPLOWO2_02_FULL_37_19]OGK59716.1 MAG: alpha-amylase [Ca